ncbi:MAG: M15 family metallopeptidase [Hyphomicrobiaceae bacterium]|nr:MAG: M15 family metallopeptidase [Hyphomicrobiaceae bacterium]
MTSLRGRSLTLLVAVVSALATISVRAAETEADRARLLDILVKSYPEFLERHEGGAIVWKDGTRMPFDDGIDGKDFEALLDKPSLKDMFYAPYPLSSSAAEPSLNIDPGRVRYEPFFAKMYGDCRKREVEKSLVNMIWLPKKWGKPVKISKVNGAAEALAKVSAELDQLPASFDKYLFPPAGTYNCRVIAGTSRISAHGAGIAIDISTRHAHYWFWSKGKGDPIPYRNAIPPEIVAVFEKHGFIWGGKWYHYDTMHFEYRPEIIAAGAK